MRKCPFCRKEVQEAATICVHCGSHISDLIKNNDKKTKGKFHNEDEMMALFGCTWSLPANFGACICCRSKIVFKRFWWCSGVQGLFFSGVTLPLLFKRKLKRLRLNHDYQTIKEPGDIIINIAEIKKISIMKGRRWTTIIITKKNGQNFEFMMRYGASQFSELYSQVSFEVA